MGPTAREKEPIYHAKVSFRGDLHRVHKRKLKGRYCVAMVSDILAAECWSAGQLTPREIS